MIVYATVTGTKRNLALMYMHQWRLLVVPPREWMPRGFRYAIDNGAWGAYQRQTEWDQLAFERVVLRYGEGADWVIAPDIVCGGAASLERSLQWLPLLLRKCPRVLLAVQDGMTDADLRPWVNDRVGIFVGGSTDWKKASLPMWGRLKAETGCWLHVGRVNTARRIRLCQMSGADSIDGTSGARFAVSIAPLSAATQQGALELFK